MSGGTGLTGLVQLAASGPSPLWYATRAGGTVALVLLTATVALGIATGGQYVPRRMARFELGTLHRNLSLLTLAFLALHIVTAIADTYVTLSWYDAVLPFGASYRPLWLGLGTVAFDLMLAILATSAIRRRHRLGHPADAATGDLRRLSRSCHRRHLVAALPSGPRPRRRPALGCRRRGRRPRRTRRIPDRGPTPARLGKPRCAGRDREDHGIRARAPRRRY